MQRIWRHKLAWYVTLVCGLCAFVYITLWTSQHHGDGGNQDRGERKLTSSASVNTSGPKILCWMLAEQKNLDTRTRAVRDTWTKRCDKVIFFSTTTNSSFPTVGLDIPDGRQHLTSKAILALAYCFKLYRDDFDWFFKADDDTFVVMENLRDLLRRYNPERALYFGYRFKPYIQQGYMSGGAGYVLSKEALRRLVIEGVVEKNCNRISGVEDLDIGRCLEIVGVTAMNTLDEYGLETFHPLSLNAYFNKIYEFPSWIDEYAYHPVKRGFKCCSHRSITFHYMRPHEMYILEYLIYYLNH